jgi:hypothetical protein
VVQRQRVGDLPAAVTAAVNARITDGGRKVMVDAIMGGVWEIMALGLDGTAQSPDAMTAAAGAAASLSRPIGRSDNSDSLLPSHMA